MDSVIDDLAMLASVTLIDLVLAGDNAIVVGMAAHRLPAAARRQAIVVGIGLALLLRIGFALVAVQLLDVIGLLLAGGLLLLWVVWKLARELPDRAASALEASCDADPGAAKSVSAAIFQIAVADVSMSLDNVLAVAGAARENLPMLVFGLVLSVLLMGVAATLVARILSRYPWLNYVGLGIIVVVALCMIHDGAQQVIAAAAGV